MKKSIDHRRGLRATAAPRWRLHLLMLMLGTIFVLVAWRLVQVQVWDHARYREQAREQSMLVRKVAARRGAILDRTGEKLSVDLLHYSLAVQPRRIKNVARWAKRVAPVLGVSAQQLTRKIRRGGNFVYLAHRLSESVAEQIRQLNLPGAILERKFSRYYPFGSAAAQVIGFCDFDNRPSGGLELEYDQELRGQEGMMIYLRDALGRRFQDLDRPAREPINGKNLITTLDIVYQQILEEELRRTVETHQAAQGSAILLEPATGRVLAMASYPGFDPNHYNRYPLASYLNRGISVVYEPGSTFKMVSLALMLEQLKLDLDQEMVDCQQGSFRLRNKVIRDHRPFGRLTLREAFEQSSNIGIIKIASRFDPAMFYRYARDFGFGSYTGIDLPAESPGILHTPKSFSRESVLFLSIGYEVAATPLQLVCAYAAIANGGRLMQPYIVQRIEREDGSVVRENHPQLIRQVISPLTARYMTEVLCGVVENGTGRSAAVEGIRIAGKTGTAQKIDPATGKYSSKDHVASFVGFFPAEQPRFALVVTIDRPRKGYYGSQVAAPAFRNMALRLIGLPAQEPLPPPEALPPIAALEDVTPPAGGQGPVRLVRTSAQGDGGPAPVDHPQRRREVLDPLPGRPSPEEDAQYALSEGMIAAMRPMPELVGLTLREALAALDPMPVQLHIEGHGVVRKQYPPPGEQLKRNDTVRLVCRE